MLGAAQKAWFLRQLRESRAAWKLWGNSVGMLDWRSDFQNLPSGAGPQWPTTGYAQFGTDDWSCYRHERAEILDFIRRERITGVASIAGDRHSFMAGVLSSSLPPGPFDPVAAEFITGSISAPGLFEALEFGLPKDHPLRSIYLYEPGPGAPLQPSANLSIMHGVRASQALQRTHDTSQALNESNPEVSPHLSFVDVGGHGYAVVRATGAELEVEFVCIPRPLEVSDRPDGGPVSYRISHRVRQWVAGVAPKLERTRLEGEAPLAI
jgi:alkaline phosphatase D